MTIYRTCVAKCNEVAFFCFIKDRFGMSAKNIHQRLLRGDYLILDINLSSFDDNSIHNIRHDLNINIPRFL